MRGAGTCLPVIVCCAFALAATQATAQDGFDTQGFNPSPSLWTNYLSVDSGELVRAESWEAGLLLNLSDDTLVLYQDGEALHLIVDMMLTSHLMFTYGFHERFQLGVDVPVVLFQNGDEFQEGNLGTVEASGGLGDLRLVPKVGLVVVDAPEGEVPIGLSLAFLLDTHLPTGATDRFQGEGFRITPRLALDYRFSERLKLGANLGYTVRPATNLPDLEVDDTFDWGVAAEIRAHEHLWLVPEVHGGIGVLSDDLDLAEVPMEGFFAFKVPANDSVLITAGGGFGLTQSFGIPLWRALLGVSYRPMGPIDTDGDGYFDHEDGCPLSPEDFDEFEDLDGCPDPDNDEDGILDIADECPMVPEDHDGFEDIDGCPDPDNDQDTLLDVVDECPNEPEDFDLYEDDDGCPDPDNDADAILDYADECPLDPEVYNGFEDVDGCPDVGIITVTCDQIEIDDTIEFETDSDVIRSVSFDLLDQIVGTMRGRQDILHVRVEGHTDSHASARHNQDLSDRRAASVMRYLTDHGIDIYRLSSIGFGEDRPIDTNDTAEGRQRNRRVEFVITEQEGCTDE